MTALEPTFLEAPAQISGLELRSAYDALQEGVVGGAELKVTAAGGTREVSVASGVGYVSGDSVTDQGLYRVRNDAAVSSNTSTAGAFEAGGIPAADATNPRIDQIVARVYDASHDASGLRKWRPEVVAGTAASGATLDNRTGAAALPGGALRLADVLVPAGATTILAGNVRDRRPWARGAYRRILRNANAAAGNDYTTASTSLVEIDGTNLKPRIECTGLPLRFTLRGRLGTTQAAVAKIAPFLDGAGIDGMTTESPFAATLGATGEIPMNMQWDTFPTPGSRRVSVAWSVSAGSLNLLARATITMQLVVEEVVRPDADNT